MATITKELWGKAPDGKEIFRYTLKNASGAYIQVSSVGAGIVAAVVPDKDGKLADVVLGYPDPLSYFGDGPCAGKVPGRYANRIARGKFTLDGVEYLLPINNGPNHLHGGPEGFQNKEDSPVDVSEYPVRQFSQCLRITSRRRSSVCSSVRCLCLWLRCVRGPRPRGTRCLC